MSEKYSPITTMFLDYAAGSNIPDVLDNMLDVKLKNGATEVRASVNGVTVIMIDTNLFKMLKGVSYK